MTMSAIEEAMHETRKTRKEVVADRSAERWNGDCPAFDECVNFSDSVTA